LTEFEIDDKFNIKFKGSWQTMKESFIAGWL